MGASVAPGSGRANAAATSANAAARPSSHLHARPVPSVVHDVLRGGGHQLSTSTRSTMEPKLGHGFGDVRVHTGPLADASARSVHAAAYTVGNNIVFRSGNYAPGTPSGDRMLAHELTHVVQQSGARTDLPIQMGASHDAYEHAAGDATSSFSAVRQISVPALRLQRLTVQCQDEAEQAPEQGTSGFAGYVWGLVEKAAPKWVISLVHAIRGKGVFGYLKDLLGGAFHGVFGRLADSGGFIGTLVKTFSTLAATAKTVLAALAKGDCKPLFDALGQLGDTLSQMAGEAWEKIKDFFAPIGDFFSDLWQKFGAPVLDVLKDYASDVWEQVKDLGQALWNATQLIRDKVSSAWSWVKKQLGIGDAPEEQNGLLQWAQTKLGEAWDWIKKQLDPIIAPIKAFAAKVAEIIPLDKIIHLRDTVHEWLQHAGDMVKALQKPSGVTADQKSLRERILPAIKASIVRLGATIASAGDWVANQIGGIVANVTGLFDSLRHNSIVGAFAGALGWIEQRIKSLDDWVEGGVKSLFDLAGQGVAKLSTFVDPVLGALEKLVHVIANVVKALPDLVLGPFWKMIPDCIKEPIKKFVIEQILSQIPVISTFLKIPDIWSKIQKLVMDFLSAVFVDGNLGKAAYIVIRFVLEAVGVNVDLFLQILANAAGALDDIIMHPMEFLKNLFNALSKGTQQFLGNIGKHIINALLEWILGPLADLGITPPKEFTLSAILDFVLQILGISSAKLRKKLEKALGPTAFKILDEAWKWISTLITGGLGGLWEQIKSRIGDLWGMIIGGISHWLTVNVIEAGIEALVKLSNPVGAIIEAIRTIYKALSFVVTRINKILAFVNSVVTSISKIAKGDIGDAANAIEKAMASTLARLIDFFADWLGIGSPGEAIKDVVITIQEKVDAAIDWLIDKAMSIARSLFGGEKEEDNPKWTAAVAGVNKELDELTGSSPTGELTPEIVQGHLTDWKVKYGFSELTATDKEGGEMDLEGGMSPSKKVAARAASDPDEGDVGTYGSLRGKKENFTPDHEPQKALMFYVRDLTVTGFSQFNKPFPADSNVADFTESKGICFLMHRSRHLQTRTYGSDGAKTVSDAKDKIAGALGKLRPDAPREAAQKKIAAVVVDELDADHTEIKNEIYNKQSGLSEKSRQRILKNLPDVWSQNKTAFGEAFEA